jgi:hypothetical protein
MDMNILKGTDFKIENLLAFFLKKKKQMEVDYVWFLLRAIQGCPKIFEKPAQAILLSTTSHNFTVPPMWQSCLLMLVILKN